MRQIEASQHAPDPDPDDAEGWARRDAAAAFMDVRAALLDAGERRGVDGAAAAAFFTGELSPSELYGQTLKAFGLRLDARTLSALVAALGGFVRGSSGVDGRKIETLLDRWRSEEAARRSDYNDRARRRRHDKFRRMFDADARTVRGVEPWRGTNWLGR